MRRDTTSWLLPVLLAVGVVAGVWYYWLNIAQQGVTTTEPDVSLATDVPAESIPEVGPLHPLAEVDRESAEQIQLRPLPPLSDSDEYFKLELSDLFGESVGAMIAGSRLIERMVATVDNLPRSHVAERTRPVSGLARPFVAEPEGVKLYAISDESYRRYDPLVNIIAASDIADLADLYRRYYPLFQNAYVELGYPNGYFNDRLVEALDDMLATPEPEGRVMLVRPHVLYEFADADLEARSSGQKLLLRMGRDNAAKIKVKLEVLRAAVASDVANR